MDPTVVERGFLASDRQISRTWRSRTPFGLLFSHVLHVAYRDEPLLQTMHALGRCCASRLLVPAYLFAFQLGRLRSFSESTSLLRSCLLNLPRTVAAPHKRKCEPGSHY